MLWENIDENIVAHMNFTGVVAIDANDSGIFTVA